VSLWPGTYVIDKAIDMQDNVVLRGSGCRATTLRFDVHPSSDMTSDDVYKHWHAVIRIIGKKNVQVSNLHIDGNKCERTLTPHVGNNFFVGIVIRSISPISMSLASSIVPYPSPDTKANTRLNSGESF
jgi:hypothetical protein